MPAHVKMQSVYPVDVIPEVFSIGGFTVEYQGREIGFDFYEYFGDFDIEKGYLVVDIRLKDLDIDSFPEAKDLTNQILQECIFTEIFYECFADEEETRFIPLVCKHFELDLPWGEENLQHTFIEKQLEGVNNEQQEVTSVEERICLCGQAKLEYDRRDIEIITSKGGFWEKLDIWACPHCRYVEFS